MSKPNDTPTIFRKRDGFAAIIILWALYMSMDSSGFTYSFEPTWYVDQRGMRSSTNPDVSAVPPVISDLDGNGEQEIVLITRDLQLKVSFIFDLHLPIFILKVGFYVFIRC